MIDTLFLLAVGALGWGLALATYRAFADRLGWPMGLLHIDFPAIPILIGVLALSCGLAFAAARWSADQGWVVVLFGVMLAVFWIGFLRVGSQSSLFLAPIATVLLLIGWLGAPLGSDGTGLAAQPPGSDSGERLTDRQAGFDWEPRSGN